MKTNPNWTDLDYASQGKEVSDPRYKLYSKACKILLNEGFYFSHCYWNLDGREHQVAESADCDDPGISLSCPREDGSFYIESVVETDNFSSNMSGGILINSEEQLKPILNALILLIKNWHKRLIKVEDFYEKDLIPYTEEMLEKDKHLLIGVVEFEG